MLYKEIIYSQDKIYHMEQMRSYKQNDIRPIIYLCIDT